MEVVATPSVFHPPRLFALPPDPRARVHRIKTDADEIDDPLDFEIVLAEREAKRLRRERAEEWKRKRHSEKLAARAEAAKTSRARASAALRASWTDPEIARARLRRYAAAANGVLFPSLAVCLLSLVPGFRGISAVRQRLLDSPGREGEVRGFRVKLIEVDRNGDPVGDQGNP